jgi:hypothetical protein
MRVSSQPAMLLVGLWLLLWGVLNQEIRHIRIPHQHTIVAIVAIVAGIACLVRRN